MKTLFTFFISTLFITAAAQEPTLLWLQGIGGNSQDDVTRRVTKTEDGGFIVGIESSSNTGTGNLDSFCYTVRGESIFFKYNADATILEWAKCTPDGSYLFPQDDSSVILIGITQAVPSGWAYEITKQNQTGINLWQRTYGGQHASAILRDAIATKDGGYIMIGETNYTDTDFTIHHGSSMTADIGIIKVDSNGNKVWARVIGGSDEDNALSVIEGPGGGCYVLGSTASIDGDCTGNHGSLDDFVARLDSSGNLLWHRDLGGTGEDGISGWGTLDGKSGILMVSASNSNDGDEHHHIGGYNIWVFDLDSNNNIVWENSYGSPFGDAGGNSICRATDGSIWLTGGSGIAGGEVDTTYGAGNAWIVHTDSTGNFLSAKVLGGTGDDLGTMIYPLSNGSIITGGNYEHNNGTFISVTSFGGAGTQDAFIAVFEPSLVGIQNIQYTDAIKIFPNPATDNLYIIMRSQSNYYTNVAISDILGRPMYQSESIHSINKIDVSNWARGVYFVQINTIDGTSSDSKIVVQ